MVDRTQRAIVDAFNRLIADRRFDQITAVEIAAEAGVSKATFYRYFKDKYDVMNRNYQVLLDQNALAEGCRGYRDLYRKLFAAGTSELAPIRRAFQSMGVNSLENYVFGYSREFVVRVTKLNREGRGLTPAEDLQLDVFCYGVSKMYRKWIYGEYRVDVGEAADKLFEMMPESLRGYWLP